MTRQPSSDAPPPNRALHTWLVDVELPLQTRGPVEFARWLRRVDADDAYRFIAAHAFDPAEDARAPGPRIREDLQEALAEVDAGDVFARHRVLIASDGDDTLERAAERDEGVGVIVARPADTPVLSVSRLGRTARRLLRRLPGPIAVVPEDYEAPEDPGSIVVATALDDSSDAAERLATALGEQLGLETVTVRVDPTAARDGEGPEGEPSDPDVVAYGRVVQTVLEVARERDAAMIVCGARGLGLLGRLILGSVSTGLCAAADRPVVVVPAK